MKTKTKSRLVLLIFLPLIIGFFIEKLMGAGITKNNQLYLSVAGILLSLWSFGGMVFWFFVGRSFGKLNIPTIKSFILGNIVWGISIIIFIWQMKLLDDTSRNLLLTAISQHYVLGFVGIGARIVTLFTNNIHGTTVVLIAYILMLVVFSLGFLSGLRSKSYYKNSSIIE